MKNKEESANEAIRKKFGSGVDKDERISRKSYWDWVGARPDGKVDEMEAVSEDAAVYEPVRYSSDQLMRLQAIRTAWPILTELEKQIVELVGVEEMTIREAADALDKSKWTVQDALDRARVKIQKIYEDSI